MSRRSPRRRSTNQLPSTAVVEPLEARSLLTDVGGVINTNTVWADTSTPYRLTENLFIQSGATLTIAPGVTVTVEGGEALIVGRDNSSARLISQGATISAFVQLEGISQGTIQDNVFTASSSLNLANAGAVTVTGNTFENSFPMTVTPNRPGALTNNSFLPGVKIGIFAGGITQTTQWPALAAGVNYELQADVSISGSLTIGSSASVTRGSLQVGQGGAGMLSANNVRFQTPVNFVSGSSGALSNSTFDSQDGLTLNANTNVTLTSNTFAHPRGVLVDPNLVEKLAGSNFAPTTVIQVLSGTVSQTTVWEKFDNVDEYQLSRGPMSVAGDLLIQGGLIVTALTDAWGTPFALNVGTGNFAGSIQADGVTFRSLVELGNLATGAIQNSVFDSSREFRIQQQSKVTLSGNQFTVSGTVVAEPEGIPDLVGNQFAPGFTIVVRDLTIGQGWTGIGSPTRWGGISNVTRYLLQSTAYIGAELSIDAGVTVEGAVVNSWGNVAAAVVDTTGSLNATGVNFIIPWTVRSGGAAFLRENTFVRNSLVIQSGAVVDIKYNDFSASGNDRVVFEGSGGPINLRDNYWGATTRDGVEAKIVHQADNAGLPLAEFEPFIAPDTIGNRVWEDLNADGVQDLNEPGLANIDVSLFQVGPDGLVGTGDDNLVDAKQTEADGTYLFTSVSSGNYYVQVGLAGYVAAAQDQGDDKVDSDIDPQGRTAPFSFSGSTPQLTKDAGLIDAAPQIQNFGGNVTYAEGALGTIVSSNANVNDVGSPDFNTGVLTVGFNTGSLATDRLEIRSQGTGAGQVNTSGSNVRIGTTAIGTFTGGQGVAPLVITFNANSTKSNVESVVRAIAYRNVGDNPTNFGALATRTIQMQLTDGDGGTSDPVEKQVTVSATNDAPTLQGLGAPATAYTENAAFVRFAPTAVVSDPDSADFASGTLTLQLATAVTGDSLGIRNEGTAAGQIGVSGANVTFGGTVVGSFTGGAGTTPLVVSLNGNASLAAVQALVRNARFTSTSDNPTNFGAAPTRTVTVQLTDGDGGTSAVAQESITITAVNDAPTVTNIGPTVAYVENAAPVQILGNSTTVADADSANFAGGSLRVGYTSGGTASDRLAIRNVGTGTGQIGVSGSNVTFEGTVIGTFSGGSGAALLVSFNASATPAAAQALARAITFANVSEKPAAADRVLRFELKDGDGGTTTFSKTVQVTAANDVPVLGGIGGSIAYTENAAPVQVFASTSTVADVDSTDLSNGRLTIALANGISGDRLTIRNVGTGVNQVSVSGSNVLVGGVVIGAFTGGTGATPLVVTFNAASTPAKAQLVLRNILYTNTGDNPTGLGNRTTTSISATLTDGDGGTSAAVSKTITLTARNDAPAINAWDGSVTYTENGTGILIDSNAVVVDPDSADFASGRLTVNFTANGQATDRIFIRNQGTAAGQIGVSGSNVSFGGTVIGTFTGGVGTTPLVVTFNGNSSPAAAQVLLRNLLYSNTSDTPPTAPRTVQARLVDGDGGVSNLPTKTINVTAVNDVPVVGGFTGQVTYRENSPAILIDNDATVTDLDSANFATGSLTVQLAANGQASDVLSIRNQGTAAGQIGVSGNNVTFGGVLIGTRSGGTNLANLVVSLNANATPTATRALIRNLLFQHTSESPSAATRTVSVRLADGDGGTSAAATKSITLTPVNDASVVGNFQLAATYIAGANATRLAPTATVSDVDSANFAGGSVVLSFTSGGAGTNVLGVRNEGVGAGQIGLSGSNVTFGGVVIGSLPAGAGVGGTPLTVNLNSAATVPAVQALVRNLNYRSTAANPTGPKTLRLVLRDGDGGVTTANKTLNITPAASVAASAFANYGDWAQELSA